MDVAPDTPLLWVIRERLRLTGTKFGCGVGQCGACKHPLQLAWIVEQVPQCGYCQPGQIVQAAALLAQNPTPSDAQIVEAMKGNLCRCAAYLRIKRTIKRAAQGH